jgi:uroporphyrinogen-III synthase
MQKNKLNILSTRPLNESIINEAAEQNVLLDCIPFIETKPVNTPELTEKVQRLSEQNIIAVFTSMNAVEVVKEYLPSKTGWKIFSIGQTTKELIEGFFGKENIAGTADDAGTLSDVIIEKNPKEVFFFCGDQRRDELPEKLIANNISVQEIVVYRTIATPQKTLKHYDGILFFSPSAVESFFSANTIDNNSIVFAIGSTTAIATKQRVNNQVVVADKPGKEALVKKMLEYFSKEKNRIDE